MLVYLHGTVVVEEEDDVDIAIAQARELVGDDPGLLDAETSE